MTAKQATPDNHWRVYPFATIFPFNGCRQKGEFQAFVESDKRLDCFSNSKAERFIRTAMNEWAYAKKFIRIPMREQQLWLCGSTGTTPSDHILLSEKYLQLNGWLKTGTTY